MSENTKMEERLIAQSTAPRVTLADVNANIRSVSYFTAKQGVLGQYDGPSESTKAKIPDLDNLGLMTFCTIVLKNGFTVTGESACVSFDNFDPIIGQELAYKMAFGKVWGFMGYHLKQTLHEQEELLSSVLVPKQDSAKTYIGTKVIHAEPMNRLNYNVFRGWTLPADENGDDEGYLVEYTDGSGSNVGSHAGYVSWYPKEVFEAAYKEVGKV